MSISYAAQSPSASNAVRIDNVVEQSETTKNTTQDLNNQVAALQTSKQAALTINNNATSIYKGVSFPSGSLQTSEVPMSTITYVPPDLSRKYGIDELGNSHASNGPIITGNKEILLHEASQIARPPGAPSQIAAMSDIVASTFMDASAPVLTRNTTTATVSNWNTHRASGPGMFTAANDVFTAPATGTYLVMGHVTLNGANHTFNLMQIVHMRAGQLVENLVCTGQSESNDNYPGDQIRNHAGSAIAALEAGDTIQMRLRGDNWTSQGITLFGAPTTTRLSVLRVA